MGQGQAQRVEVVSAPLSSARFRAADDKIVGGRLFASVEAAMDFATEPGQVARTA